MFELSTIFVPVDAASGGRVLSVAEYLAEVYDARVHSTHVVPVMPDLVHQVLFPYAAMGEDVVEFEQELVKTAERELRRALDGKEDNPQAHPHTVLYGPVVDGLLRTLARVGPDLLVVGAWSESGQQRHHLGSTAARLVDGWPGPVFVVRETAAGRPFGRVALATDFGPAAGAHLRAAVGLALRTANPLTVMTVLPDTSVFETDALLKGAVRVDERAVRSRGERNARQHFKRLIESLDVPFPEREGLAKLDLEVLVRAGDPVEEIRAFIGEKDDTLLVVGRRSTAETKSVGLGRMAEQLVRRTPAHVLVVPVD
jgi:nucleotide-binding universal stress UspA family protein